MSSNGTASTLLSSFAVPSPASPAPSAAQAKASSPPASPSLTGDAGPSAAPAASSAAPAPSNPPSSAAPPASQAPSPSPSQQSPVNSPTTANTPPPAASSAPPPAASSAPAAQSSAAPAPASSQPQQAATTQVFTASSVPPVTEVLTSVVLVTPSMSIAGQTPAVIVVTSVLTRTNTNQQAQPTGSIASSVASPSATDGTRLANGDKQVESGLSTGGKTAIAVVIPVVVVALLVLGALFFWRRRKQRKDNEDERRKEVEEYGYNPNHDPTLPAVGMGSEMAEDQSGYRGWGNTATSSNRKASTTLTSGMTYSDSNSNPGGYQSPNSPTHGTYSDANSNDPLVNGRRETLDADGIAALGAVPTSANTQAGVQRGPSNASSSYSAANHSDNSGEYPGMPNNNPNEYYEQGYGNYQEGPYGGNAGQQPVIRDVSARRNTRIENPSVYPQGNSGVATNF